MKYVVVFMEGYVGCFFDDNAKVFDNADNAQVYADALNVEFAHVNHCEVKDLGDYYIVESVEEFEANED